MRRDEIVKYFRKKYGIEVKITYNGWTIHEVEHTRWWAVDIPFTDSISNDEEIYGFAGVVM